MNSAARHIPSPDEIPQSVGRIFVLFDDGGMDVDGAIARLAVERRLNARDDVVIVHRFGGSDLPADEDAIRELVRLSTTEAKSELARATAMAERARFPKAAGVGLYPLRITYAFLSESENGNV